VLVFLSDDGPAVRDAVMTVLMASCAVLAFGALGLVVVHHRQGLGRPGPLNFYTQDMSRAGPLAPLTTGGMGHALVGTLWMVGIAVVLTVPIGLVGRRLPRRDPQPARLLPHRGGSDDRVAEHSGRPVHLRGVDPRLRDSGGRGWPRPWP
jgi:ABC-type Fe3+ transport system permease subunit